MTDLLMNMIGDLKTCLALALGSGFIFGYIYNKFKAREKYKPEVKNIEKKIYSKKNELNLLTTKNSEIVTEVDKYKNELEKTSTKIDTHKKELTDLEKKADEITREENLIKNQYTKQENILNDYKSEIIKLKSKLRVDNIENIEKRKVQLQEEANSIVDTYKQKCDSYEGLYTEKRELEKEISTLTSDINSLKASIHKKEQFLQNSEENILSIKDKLQNEFNKLIQSKEENEDKIAYFKKELLSIKNRLS